MNNIEMKNRWIALYVENEVGVLAKVSGLFSAKYAIWKRSSIIFDFLKYLRMAEKARFPDCFPENPTIYSLLRLEPQRMRLFPE